jgi:pyruvate,orthophosphate dikinase
MQARAIFEAACNKVREDTSVQLQILLPLLSHHNELKVARELLTVVADEVMAEKGNEISYKVGAMIETPRAALTADQVAEQAEFFSLGTNDLTQMTFGYSRDDAEREFLLDYVERGILSANPFRELDGEGVGELVKMAVQKGRVSRPDLSVGACGEHAFWSKSIEFFHRTGLDYVSCGPTGIPRVRMAVAQAALKHRDNPQPLPRRGATLTRKGCFA